MSRCTVCDQKSANCDCTAREQEQDERIAELEEENARLRKEKEDWQRIAGIQDEKAHCWLEKSDALAASLADTSAKLAALEKRNSFLEEYVRRTSPFADEVLGKKE
jgi:hypothetical protein